MSVQKVLDASDEMMTGIAAKNTVISVGVNLHIKLVARLHESFSKFGRVLEVHIVIRHTMNQQEVTLDLLETMER